MTLTFDFKVKYGMTLKQRFLKLFDCAVKLVKATQDENENNLLDMCRICGHILKRLPSLILGVISEYIFEISGKVMYTYHAEVTRK
jgi:hypothetical protein